MGTVKTLSVNRPHLVAVIGGKEGSAQTNVDLLGLAVDLMARFSELSKTLEGFVELYEPILQTLRDIDSHVLSPMLQVRIQFISV
jgi:nucleolar protein 14